MKAPTISRIDINALERETGLGWSAMQAAAQSSCATAAGAACGVSADRYAAGLRVRAVLRDGTMVCMRAIRPDDKERLRIAFEGLSSESVYQRFFHQITELTPGELRHLTELDFRDHVGLAMTIEEETAERLIAVCRFIRVETGGDRAEVGFAVADEYQHRGAATLLLQQLLAVARGCGVREFVAQVFDDNLDMVRVLQNSGLPFRQRIENGIRDVALTLASEMQPAEPTRANRPSTLRAGCRMEVGAEEHWQATMPFSAESTR